MATNSEFSPVTIRLIVDLPVDPKHSLFAGTVHKTIPVPEGTAEWKSRRCPHWVQGHGAPVGVLVGEFELILNEEETAAAAYPSIDHDDLPF